jgi:simple sugar transport system ATP-binding protein
LTRGRWFLSHRAVQRRAAQLIERFNVRPPSPSLKIGTLSGGNVQRAVLARELGDDVHVLVAANPCFGLDFKSTAEIRSRIMQARNRGAAVLLVSEDLDEILQLSDRIVVMFDGRLALETDAAHADVGAIGRAMAGRGEGVVAAEVRNA